MNAINKDSREEVITAINNLLDRIILVSYHGQRGLILRVFSFYFIGLFNAAVANECIFLVDPFTNTRLSKLT